MAFEHITVDAALRRRALRDREAPFVKIEGRWLSAAELDDRADTLAAGLSALGVTKGDRVATILANCTEMLEIFFACAKLGAILVPLNAWLKGAFLEHQLVDSGAAFLVAVVDGLACALPTIDASSVTHCIAMGDAAPVMPVPTTRWIDLAKPGPAPEVELSPADPMAIIYTSGTTGLPKGCMLPHGYYTSASRVIAERGWLAPDDRLLTAWPLFHTSGQAIALMSALMIGGTVAFESAFSASTFLSTATTDGATVVAGVGFMGAALLATPTSPADRDHQVRLAWWVPMPPEQQHAFEDRFGITVMSEAFGQTECFPVTMAPVSDRGTRGTLGTSTGHFDLRLLNDDDAEVADGTVGEICIRPLHPHVMYSGYWGNAEATVAASGNLWHHTGDLAMRLSDGSLQFVDRKKDAMRRRGENVSSVELEAAIRRHPAIKDVAVCAISSDVTEDDIRAVVVADGDAQLEPEEVFAFFKASLPYYAIPRYVEIVPALPANALGRVMKHAIRATPLRDDAWDFHALGLTVGRDERRAG